MKNMLFVRKSGFVLKIDFIANTGRMVGVLKSTRGDRFLLENPCFPKITKKKPLPDNLEVKACLEKLKLNVYQAVESSGNMRLWQNSIFPLFNDAEAKLGA